MRVGARPLGLQDRCGPGSSAARVGGVFVPARRPLHMIMKKAVIVTLSLCLIGLLAPGLALAKKGGKGGKRQKQKQEEPSAGGNSLARYDTNKDGQFDDEEIAALKKDFASNKPEDLKKYDKNENGKLDSAEVEALKADLTAKPQAQESKGGKGNKRSKRR